MLRKHAMGWCVASVLTAAGCNDPPVICTGSQCNNNNPDTGVIDMMQPDAGFPDTGEPPQMVDAFNSGLLTVTPDGTTLGYTALTGRAGLILEEGGYTNALVFATGLMPNVEYGAHVHAKRCNDEGGGPHYKIDTAIADVLQQNEIWPAVTTDADGKGVGYLRVQHYAREDALSVVIHQTGSTERIACADLTENADVIAYGSFEELPDGAGLGITGTATLRRSSFGTTVNVGLNGTFTSTTPYPAHVHAKPCADEAGGPHYKIDMSITDTLPQNEIWPDAVPNQTNNTAVGVAMTPHIARYDAWSIVVHDPVTRNRLICADLRWVN
jgi:hypothetical protein